MRTRRVSAVAALVAALMVLTTLASAAAPVAQPAREGGLHATVINELHHDTSPALRDIPPITGQPGAVEKEVPNQWRLPQGSVSQTDQNSIQREIGPNTMPPLVQDFDGVNNISGYYPPDTNGEVGPNHYVQTVNVSFAVYSKTGALLYGPALNNTLWTGFGGYCETTNDGDPVVLYDQLADRWLMSQFALPNFPNGPFLECIAVSATGDPTGAWHRYAFQTSTTKMDDYPKLSVWPDAYYMTTNLFNAGSLSWAGEGAYAFDRAAMIAGTAATMQLFELGPSAWGGALPSDLDGTRLPPTGSPAIFTEVVDGAWDPVNWPTDALLVRRFHVDWANPANSTYTDPPIVLPVNAFDAYMCNFGNCAPQPGTAQKLDLLADRMMFRLVYRNFGDHDALVVNHTVNVGTVNAARAGIRWYELRNPWTTPTIYQQGTYGPADTLWRWMGSIAFDHVGNIALGYSGSSTTVYPSIYYTGRLVSDPLGTLPQGEGLIKAGTGSQTGTAGRWGDYSDITVDPTDDCTFWYTTEYIQTTGGANWRTRISSFKFPNCTNAPTAVEVANVNSNAATVPYVLYAGLAGLVLLSAALALRLRARKA